MSSPEQLRIDHGSRREARERVDAVLQCFHHLSHHIGRGDSPEAVEYWYARSYRLLSKLAFDLEEDGDQPWSDEA